MNLNDLRKQRNQKQLDLNGKEKLKTEELVGQTVTITDFSTYEGRNGRTGIILLKEHPTKFAFSNSILTGILDQILLDDEAMADFKQNGLKVMYEKRHSSKSGRDYMDVKLPE